MIKNLSIIILTFIFSSCSSQSTEKQDNHQQTNMEKRYFSEDDFNEHYGKELVSAVTVYESMKANGFKKKALATFDFDFTSDNKTKLDSLSKFLKKNYGFNLKKPEKQDEVWILSGDATELPYTEENLLFWAIDLYCKGFEFDSRLSGYGALTDSKDLKFLDLSKDSADKYYEKGIDALDNRDFGTAIIYFTTSIELDPKIAETWRARGYCKNEIYAWKAARNDFDKAIKLDPDFVDAYIIRGTNFDEAEEYNKALKDYNKALEIDPKNQLAYFNRGNTMFNIGKKKEACEDWTKAKSLGSEYATYAQERIDAECK